MAPDLVGDLYGLLALAALLLLPGLLIVRAPWPAIPFLSASFWIVSWGWLPASGRHRLLIGALVSSALLASLRLAKPLRATRPGWPTLVVLAVAVLRLTPLALWPVAPGADMSFHSLCAVLMSWKDGLPSTYEPLLPIPAFGVGGIGLPALAADVARLAGFPEPRAALVASLAAHGLLHVALFAMLSRLCAAPAAALASVVAVGMVASRDFFCPGGSPGSLALAFLVAAAALLVRGTGRSPAVAAGVFTAAAIETQPALAMLALLMLPLAGAVAAHAPAADRRAVAERLGVASLAAAVAAAPLVLRAGLVLSPGWAQVARALTTIALSVAAACLIAVLLRRRSRAAGLAVALVLALGAEGARRGYARASAGVMVSGDDLEAMGWLRDHTRPTDVVCNEPRTPGIWIPALAGRRITVPELPPAALVRLEQRCTWTYASDRFFFGPPAPGPRQGAAAFRNAAVSILQNP